MVQVQKMVKASLVEPKMVTKFHMFLNSNYMQELHILQANTQSLLTELMLVSLMQPEQMVLPQLASTANMIQDMVK